MHAQNTDVYKSRKYAALRIVSGLYLQPADNGTDAYVIASYEDDHATRWAWGELTEAIAKVVQRPNDRGDLEDALTELRDAGMWSIGHATKRDAITAALA